MTDPTFTTRAELDAWRQRQVEDFCRFVPPSTRQASLLIEQGALIDRVTRAHKHLIDGGK